MRFFGAFAVLLIAALPRAHGGSIVEFNISGIGLIQVELYDRDKPVTVSNFLKYVTSGTWSNMIMHRAVTNFVIQGGGIGVANRFGMNPTFVALPTFGTITNEFSVGRTLSNVYGTLAMAKLGGNTNSASSQWFFNLTNNVFLDAPGTNGYFVVFGSVISDTNVLNKINLGAPSSAIAKIDLSPIYGPILAEMPYLVATNPMNPTFGDLLYTDIRLVRYDMDLQVHSLASGAQEISWNSFANKPNIVEFVTNITATNWQPIASNLGDGQRMAITNSSADPNRFFRVHFGY